MSEDREHLHAEMRAFADEDDASRIRLMRTDRWISYARADAALAACEDLLTFPKRTRMPNLLLYGPTNNGKTMIVEKFRRAHPPMASEDAPHGIAQIPVLNVQMPPGPDEARFFEAILDAMAVPPVSGAVAKRQATTVRFMRDTGVQLLVIDEAHNLLSGTALQQRRLLNLLRWLGNELKIPLVAAGTVEAFHAIQSDDQLANRFEPMPLPPWPKNQEYRQMLKTLEALLPLRRASGLAKHALAAKIHSATGGILGEVVVMITRTAVQAVTSGEERITAKLIDEAGYVSPAQRRRAAV